eukprot:COSAG05_NODE_11852_length_493_cov_1.025381_1_plen_64_part_10
MTKKHYTILTHFGILGPIPPNQVPGTRCPVLEGCTQLSPSTSSVSPTRAIGDEEGLPSMACASE